MRVKNETETDIEGSAEVTNRVSNGVKAFYVTVLLTLLAGAGYSFLEWHGYFAPPATAPVPVPKQG